MWGGLAIFLAFGVFLAEAAAGCLSQETRFANSYTPALVYDLEVLAGYQILCLHVFHIRIGWSGGGLGRLPIAVWA